MGSRSSKWLHAKTHTPGQPGLHRRVDAHRKSVRSCLTRNRESGNSSVRQQVLQREGRSTPRSDGSGHQPYGDLLSALQLQHQTVITLPETLTENDLDQPCRSCPPGFKPFFGTWRQVFLMRSMHWMIHRGIQIRGTVRGGRSANDRGMFRLR